MDTVICPAKIKKKLEGLGWNHADALFEGWKGAIEMTDKLDKLTAAQRKKIPKGEFGKPSERSPSGGQGGWPLDSCGRAKAAKSYYGRYGGGDEGLKSRINGKLKECGMAPVGEETKKNEGNTSAINIDDVGRLRQDGLLVKEIEDEGKKKHGNGQWGDKTERCIQERLSEGMAKDKAIPICRNSTGDK